jgi:hypothetical protein
MAWGKWAKAVVVVCVEDCSRREIILTCIASVMGTVRITSRGSARKMREKCTRRRPSPRRCGSDTYEKRAISMFWLLRLSCEWVPLGEICFDWFDVGCRPWVSRVRCMRRSGTLRRLP